MFEIELAVMAGKVFEVEVCESIIFRMNKNLNFHSCFHSDKKRNLIKNYLNILNLESRTILIMLLKERINIDILLSTIVHAFPFPRKHNYKHL